MSIQKKNANDRLGYNEHYQGKTPRYAGAREFQKHQLRPFYQGGVTKGYVHGLATSMLLSKAKPGDMVLDAGSGLGKLSVFLANRGLDVIGVDISEEGCAGARRMAADVGAKCRFLAESLEQMSIEDASIDYIIGHGALHHFIKYDVPPEFKRVLKPGGEGFFADSFGENPLYRLFHNKEQMERLGDVSLTRTMIYEYFKDFDVEIIPTDWFVMLDKLYLKLLPEKFVRRASRMHFLLDRKIPLPTALAGAIVTKIKA